MHVSSLSLSSHPPLTICFKMFKTQACMVNHQVQLKAKNPSKL